MDGSFALGNEQVGVLQKCHQRPFFPSFKTPPHYSEAFKNLPLIVSPGLKKDSQQIGNTLAEDTLHGQALLSQHIGIETMQLPAGAGAGHLTVLTGNERQCQARGASPISWYLRQHPCQEGVDTNPSSHDSSSLNVSMVSSLLEIEDATAYENCYL